MDPIKRISECQYVIVESDSQLLVTALHDPSEYNSSVGLLFKDCEILINSIQGCSIVHLR